MKATIAGEPVSLPGWAIMLLLILVGATLGFISGDSLTAVAAAAAGIGVLLLFFLLRLSVPVKLIFLLVAVSFLQRLLGYFKLGEVRGLNIGNLLLLAGLGYWIWSGLKRGSIYRPTPVDFWLAMATVAAPVFSIVFTTVFRKVPGYSSGEQLVWYKQWVTPFVYFFLVCQTMERKSDIRLLFYLVLALTSLAVLEGLPEALKFTNWHLQRSEGILGQANDYAALIAIIVPFLFLVLFLLKERPVLRLIAFGLLGGMALTMITTYSRAGYVGFAIALILTLYVTYRGTGKIPLGTPALAVMGAFLLPIVAVPELLEFVQNRFELETYKRAKRKSYSEYGLLNQYSGDRLELWKGALGMAQDYPLVGVGFHTFELELPRYSAKGESNYPHNQFLGALAEGGIFWLSLLVAFFWKLFRFLYQNWRASLAASDGVGQVICGGAVVSFVVMIWIAMSNDFLNPGPKNIIFWVMMACAMRYGTLARAEEDALEETAQEAGARGG
jgi:O-antigen ligase